jgi:chemotaxis methyl-accepting protein methylase
MATQRLQRFGKTGKFRHLIRNRTHDLPGYSVAAQAMALSYTHIMMDATKQLRSSVSYEYTNLMTDTTKQLRSSVSYEYTNLMTDTTKQLRSSVSYDCIHLMTDTM